MSDLSHLPLDELTLTENERPKMPPIQGATDMHRQNGKQLAAIHRHYLMYLSQVAAVFDQIAAGNSAPEELSSLLLSSDMRRNLQTAGTICGQQCQMLNMHHNIEQYQLFPALEAKGNQALAALVAQLRKEHEIVHELLIRLEAAARDLIDDPGAERFDVAYDLFKRLRAVIQSHFGYEEREIGEAIGYYLGGI